jgi:uncharacterized SAM-binding protein YcdF (DUF218 family)
MLLESRSRNTYENALFTARLLRERGWRRILLVTSASHMPRAVLLFRHQELQVVPASTDVQVVRRPFALVRLMPDVEALRKSTRAIKEYAGIAVYWLRGYL